MGGGALPGSELNCRSLEEGENTNNPVLSLMDQCETVDGERERERDTERCQCTCGMVLHSLYMKAGLELYYIHEPMHVVCRFDCLRKQHYSTCTCSKQQSDFNKSQRERERESEGDRERERESERERERESETERTNRSEKKTVLHWIRRRMSNAKLNSLDLQAISENVGMRPDSKTERPLAFHSGPQVREGGQVSSRL